MSLAVSFLAFLTTIWGQGVIFTWLLNLTGISALLVWASIGLISLRFRAAWKAQGRPLSDLPYTQPLFPLLPIGVIVLGTLLFVAEGYSAVKVQPFSARVSVGVGRISHITHADVPNPIRTSSRRTSVSCCISYSTWGTSCTSGTRSGDDNISYHCWKST